MEDQAKSLGVKLDRLAAVDGASLAKSEVLSAGALGCFQSHRAAWAMVAEVEDQYAAVFEDDTHLSSDLPKFLADQSWIPGDADIVHLGCARRHCEVTGKALPALGRKLYRPTGENASAEAYIISKHCAAKLHRDFVSIDREFDQILFNGGRPDLVIYKLFPALGIQDQFVSQSRFDGLISRPFAGRSAKLRGFAKVRHEFQRSMRQAASALGLVSTKRVRVGYR
ncbi:GR25 family glycosyltransferase involved in LPS biosynthesis [Aminobacter aminovorans]|uniref:Lipooligosaccharide biosynthesis protein lex-1 n=2 Tax=Aminobacter aminovorans TaxID=83263 RepID=A0A380WQT0_AMIAI|nr:GR25 family glycosyltransferase involved in LPS biosynthesis [Aminobacter aminovorans]SUU90676.1 Lipooligosaccharide biosynthesis protein lex-1 [Aminobacter aminovorans]